MMNRLLLKSYQEQTEWLLLVCCLVALFFISSISVAIQIQVVVSVVLVCLMIVFDRYLPRQGLPRMVFFSLAVYLVLRYFYWRLFFTIIFTDILSFIAAIALFAAEFYCITVFLLSVFIGLRPIVRSTERDVCPISAPTVDVFVPSYDEDPDLLKVTLIAARGMRYPEDKLKVYLLDDGATRAKRNQQDRTKAKEAWKRRRELKNLCRELGIHYMTRDENEQAKAGNMNSALPHTKGDLVVVLDADHVPTVDFLEKTVHHFIDDERLFLVQTPHFFVNPDPIEKNLDLFQKMPSENLMFYGAIQPGLDFWGGSFFCGSAAVLRREALKEAHGFAGDTITEDAETALTLHSKGWHSRYVKHPLISGLQPETFSSFMVQRMRWAQGMIQIFLLKNPLLMGGLSWQQKFCYLSNIGYWFFPFARMVFAFAPAAFLVFGLHIYSATVGEIFIYTVPYLAALIMASNYMYSKVRWNFISNVYETMQSMYSLAAVLAVLKNPRSPSFGVTPKSETLREDFISPLVKPFYFMTLFTTMVFILGIWRFYEFSDERALVAITLFWTGYNFMLYSASLGALMERKQRRVNPRLPINLHAYLELSGRALKIPVRLSNISVGGAHLTVDSDYADLVFPGSLASLTGINPINGKPFDLPLDLVSRWEKPGGVAVGTRFQRNNLAEYKDVVMLAHGDSERWVKWMSKRAPDPGTFSGILLLTKIGVTHLFRYLNFILFKPMLIWFSAVIEKKPALSAPPNKQV